MKTNVRLIVTVALLLSTPYMFAHTSGFKKLDDWVEIWKTGEQTYFGYPVNQTSDNELREFYEWYIGTGMYGVSLNNAGDPMTDSPWEMSSQAFEREVIEFFAPLYDFSADDVWGLVTQFFYYRR